MLSHIYRFVIDLVVSLQIRRGPGVLTNVSVQENRAPNKIFFKWQSLLF